MRKYIRFLHQPYRYRILSPSLVLSVSEIFFLPIFLLFLFFLILFFPHLCLAFDVTLGWTANAPEENVQGYKIYVARSSRYDNNQQLKDNFHYEYVFNLKTKMWRFLADINHSEQFGDSLLKCVDLYNNNPTCTFLNVPKNTAFYFTATAFNDLSESDYSDEAA